MKILGLDVATHTGVAICEDGKIIDSGVWDYSKVRGKDMHNGHIFNALRSNIASMFCSYDIDHVVYERSHFRGAASFLLVGMSTHVLSACAQWSIPVSDVHTLTLKKWATGDGRASKADMMQRATEATGKVYESDDESDAVNLALYKWDMLKGE